MIRSFLTVSSGTLASRLLGFARDSMIAALLGAGPVADAFLVAFQLVNVVRRLLTEGALNAALVPAWLRVRETEGAAAAAAFAGRVLGTVSAALFAATALLGLLMPLVITALAPGFAGRADAANCGRQRPPDAALSRLCRARHGDDGAVERAGPFCADGVLAAAVQHRADRGHDRAAGWRQDAVLAAQIAGRHGRHRRPVAALDAGRCAAAATLRRRCGSRSTRRCAAFSARRSPA